MFWLKQVFNIHFTLPIISGLYNELNSVEKLQTSILSEIFPFVSRTVRERWMTLMSNPAYSFLPKSRNGWDKAKQNLEKKLKMPVLHKETVTWEEHGIKFSDTNGIDLIIKLTL
jgi:hypothetical protein